MSSMRGWIVIAAIGCVGLGSAREARAQSAADAEVAYQIRPPDPKDPKARGDAPQIEATIVAAPNLTADKFILVDGSAKPPVQIPAASRRAFNQGSDTLAVAIVMLGWEMWIGNDTYLREDDPTRTAGVLVPLQAALRKLDLQAAGPPGSVGTLITYADHAKIQVPMGPLANLNARSLGTQKDYKNTKGTELVKGVELALAELVKTRHPVKLLIVISDGNDVDNDRAKAQLALLKKQALTARVRTFAIVYKAALSGPANVTSNLTAQVSTVMTAEDIGKALRSALERVADRQYLTFPGALKNGKPGLAWDGRPHDLAIQIDGQKTDSQAVVLAPKWQPTGAAPAKP